MARIVGLFVLIAVFVFESAFTTPLSATGIGGARKCLWGPSYWCHNLSNAKECNTVTHCIENVWERKIVLENNEPVCQICKDMVAHARDRLRNNDSMLGLKNVLKEYCNLIQFKIVKDECYYLIDHFAAELVKMLTSQMNPQQICSAVGFCNKADIDKLLMDYYVRTLEATLSYEDNSLAEHPKSNELIESQLKLTCRTCNQVTSKMVEKFTNANRDEMLENILHLCGEMPSFSDACANIVLTHFNDIYDSLKTNLQAPGICYVSGVCSYKYDQGLEDSSISEEELATLPSSTSDATCKLCKNLVHHLHDVLIKTPEADFKGLLEDLCKREKAADQCISTVNQYYDVIYKFVTTLDSNSVCVMINLCPKRKETHIDDAISSFLPIISQPTIKISTGKELDVNEPKFTQDEIHSMVLPIDTLMDAASPNLLVENGELCTICEYVLHFIQESLAAPATEDEIKKTVGKICDKAPLTVRRECHSYIDTYGEAVIALLIQETNPREICPKLQMCPHSVEHHDEMEIISAISLNIAFNQAEVTPTCFICKQILKLIEKEIKHHATKDKIQNALQHACHALKHTLRRKCNKIVEKYGGKIADLILQHKGAKIICRVLGMCILLDNEDLKPDESLKYEVYVMPNKETQMMPTDNENFAVQKISNSPCVLCEFVMTKLDSLLKDDQTQNEIENVLKAVCHTMPKTISEPCDKFVHQYIRAAFALFTGISPKEMCQFLTLCPHSKYINSDPIVTEDVAECGVCHSITVSLLPFIKQHANPAAIASEDMINVACESTPTIYYQRCSSMINIYGASILNLSQQDDVDENSICMAIGKCMNSEEVRLPFATIVGI